MRKRLDLQGEPETEAMGNRREPMVDALARENDTIQ
jgi:hypothetical protein